MIEVQRTDGITHPVLLTVRPPGLVTSVSEALTLEAAATLRDQLDAYVSVPTAEEMLAVALVALENTGECPREILCQEGRPCDECAQEEEDGRACWAVVLRERALARREATK